MNCNKSKLLTGLSTAFLLLLFLGLALSSSLKKSGTYDEVHYLGTGQYIFQHKDFLLQGARLHPPLFYYLASLPISHIQIPEKFFQIDNPILRGKNILFLRPDDALIFLTRLPFLIVGLCLALTVFIWCRKIFGPGPALLCLLLFILSPNILAHTRLATPDILLTFSFFLCIFILWHIGHKGMTLFKACALGAGLALSALSKYTGIIAVPIVCLIVFLHFRLWKKNEIKSFFHKKLPNYFLLSFCLFFFLMWGAYFFHFEKPFYAESAFQRKLNPSAPEIEFSLNIPLPFPEYFEGLGIQTQSVGWHSFYLRGHISKKGWWTYFVYAFLIKTPLIILITFLLGSLLILHSKHWRKHALFLLFPPITFFLIISYFRANMGLRYILPCYPFLFICAGALFSRINKFSRIPAAVLTVLVIMAGVYEIQNIHPHYLAYFNQLAGGPDQGHRHLLDSNLDWGQDLKGLATYMKEKDIPLVHLCYFGTTPPEYYQMNYAPLKELEKSHGFCAISATYLHSVYLKNPEHYQWLHNYEPYDTIGHSIFLYNIP